MTFSLVGGLLHHHPPYPDLAAQDGLYKRLQELGACPADLPVRLDNAVAGVDHALGHVLTGRQARRIVGRQHAPVFLGGVDAGALHPVTHIAVRGAVLFVRHCDGVEGVGAPGAHDPAAPMRIGRDDQVLVGGQKMEIVRQSPELGAFADASGL